MAAELTQITKADLLELAQHLELGMGEVDIGYGVIAIANFFYSAGYVRGVKDTLEEVIK